MLIKMEWKKVYYWLLEELDSGSKIKASKLMKIAKKMKKLFYKNWYREHR